MGDIPAQSEVRPIFKDAGGIALEYRQAHILPEHILLAFLRAEGPAISSLFISFGVDRDVMKKELHEILSAMPPTLLVAFDDVKVPQTPMAKKSVEFAIEEARSKADRIWISPVTWMIGLCRLTKGEIPAFLSRHGITVEKLRAMHTLIVTK